MFISYFILAMVNVVLWVPIALKFYDSWTSRKNPVSLAIVSFVLLAMWGSIAGIWVVTDSADSKIVILSMAIVSTVVAVYAHIAFYWSSKKFADSRKE